MSFLRWFGIVIHYSLFIPFWDLWCTVWINKELGNIFLGFIWTKTIHVTPNNMGLFFFLDKLEKKLQTERFLLNFDEIFVTLLLYFWLYEWTRWSNPVFWLITWLDKIFNHVQMHEKKLLVTFSHRKKVFIVINLKNIRLVPLSLVIIEMSLLQNSPLH